METLSDKETAKRMTVNQLRGQILREDILDDQSHLVI